MRLCKIKLEEISINHKKTVLDAIGLLNDYTVRCGKNGSLLIVDDDEKLVGTLTDGDIRRAFLGGYSQESKVGEVCKKTPIVIPEGIDRETIMQLMRINGISDIPVVDASGRVIRVERIDVSNYDVKKEMVAVIMAGGEGQRLRPLTENIPKPMLKVGGKPILQIIVESLRNFGFGRIIINVRYLGHMIEDHFGDGSDFGIRIDYIREPKPLGTAGSLGIIPDEMIPDGPFLVVNGDLLTTLNYRAFRDFHIAANYDFTLCGRPYEVQIPFGYPIINGDVITEFREKPKFVHLVNSGIYCLAPELIDYVPKNEYFDMPDLIRKVIEKGKRAGVFPLREKFHEIGRHESYKAAEEFYKNYFMKNEEE